MLRGREEEEENRNERATGYERRHEREAQREREKARQYIETIMRCGERKTESTPCGFVAMSARLVYGQVSEKKRQRRIRVSRFGCRIPTL